MVGYRDLSHILSAILVMLLDYRCGLQKEHMKDFKIFSIAWIKLLKQEEFKVYTQDSSLDSDLESNGLY